MPASNLPAQLRADASLLQVLAGTLVAEVEAFAGQVPEANRPSIRVLGRMIDTMTADLVAAVDGLERLDVGQQHEKS